VDDAAERELAGAKTETKADLLGESPIIVSGRARICRVGSGARLGGFTFWYITQNGV
jgi:hypothetical protein